MKLKFSYEILELEDQKFYVPVEYEAEQILQFNQTGNIIFECLMEETSIEEIVETLSKMYKNPKEQIVSFVQQFVDSLKKEGYLVE
ncbi:MAG: PqqD family protein [Bacillota bacterium]|nr:PqqD family protein [Bacillota bacterium]